MGQEDSQTVGMHREGNQREGSPVGGTLGEDSLGEDNLEEDNLEEDIQEHHDRNLDHDQRDLCPARHRACPYLFHLPCFVREEKQIVPAYF